MDNSKVPGFGRSDKQMADAFGMSVSDFKKVKKQIVSDMTKPKVTAKVTAKPKPVSPKAKPAMPKSKGPAVLAGEAAAKQLQKEISPKGMASAKAAQSKALDKKYPGLYKKSK